MSTRRARTVACIAFAALAAARTAAAREIAGAAQQPILVTSTAPANTPPALADPGATSQQARQPTLRELAGTARAIALVRVRGIEHRDGGRIRLYDLAVERTVTGAIDTGGIRVVELRVGTSRAPLLDEGERGMLLLQPMARVSYFLAQIREPDVWQASGGTGGVVRYHDDAEADRLVRVIERVRAAHTPAEIRASALEEVASGSDRLIGDGAEELRRLPALGGLSESEMKIVSTVMLDPAQSVQTRVVLIDVLGASGDRSASPVLAAIAVENPRVTEASLRARAELGAPASAGELDGLMASAQSAARAAVLRALPASRHPRTLAILSQEVAPDRPREVRLAAIDALGETRSNDALPPLATTFESDERPVRQASARAILRIGGAASDDALVTLALHGASHETRIYAAMLLATRYSSKSEPIVRLASSSPPADVVEVLEKGLQDSHGHHH